MISNFKKTCYSKQQTKTIYKNYNIYQLTFKLLQIFCIYEMMYAITYVKLKYDFRKVGVHFIMLSSEAMLKLLCNFEILLMQSIKRRQKINSFSHNLFQNKLTPALIAARENCSFSVLKCLFYQFEVSPYTRDPVINLNKY